MQLFSANKIRLDVFHIKAHILGGYMEKYKDEQLKYIAYKILTIFTIVIYFASLGTCIISYQHFNKQIGFVFIFVTVGTFILMILAVYKYYKMLNLDNKTKYRLDTSAPLLLKDIAAISIEKKPYLKMKNIFDNDIMKYESFHFVPKIGDGLAYVWFKDEDKIFIVKITQKHCYYYFGEKVSDVEELNENDWNTIPINNIDLHSFAKKIKDILKKEVKG